MWYNAFREAIMDLFQPGDLEITAEGTPESTGKFEVQIVGGKLIHSKLNGDGFVDNQSKMDKVVAAIKEAM